jgi:DNA polymerase-3 subunit delta
LKLWPDKLGPHLAAQQERSYVIAGDEPLLVQEAADQVRAAARKRGFDEREVHDVDRHYDWSGLMMATGTLSLFATRRLIELRLSKPLGVDAGKALTAFATQGADDVVVLVVAPKLEFSSTKTKWYKALEQAAVVVPITPIDGSRLADWVGRRMAARGLQPDRGAVQALVEREEGNLLACVQDIEKLLLLHGPGPIDSDAILAAVADNSRFDVFALSDAVLQGRVDRVVKILAALRAEGIAAPIVLWALSRELRTLTTIAAQVDGGRPLDQVLANPKLRIWQKQRPMVKKAFQRLGPRRCRRLLQGAAQIDLAIKGAAPGNEWDGLLKLAVGMASNVRLPAGF